MAPNIENFEGIKRWDFSLEGRVCPCCKGEGSIEELGDLHRSAGIVPCPIKYFQGHGYPTCGKDNKLHFSEYDRKHKKSLIRFIKKYENKRI